MLGGVALPDRATAAQHAGCRFELLGGALALTDQLALPGEGVRPDN